MLHGKLTRHEEGMEDLLTSNVFGLLKYVPCDVALLPFLSEARDPISGAHLREWLSDAEYVKEWQFWPTLTVEGCDVCEPDVLITLSNRDGSKTCILVEAKYRHGKSPRATQSADRPRDQLAHEYDNLRAFARKESIERYFVVYLTAHVSCRTEEIRESLAAYPQGEAGRPWLFWVSWRHLTDVLAGEEPQTHAIARDLRGLLLHMDLTMFRRLRHRQLRRPEWEFVRAPRVWSWVAELAHWSFRSTPASWSWGTAPMPEGLGFRTSPPRFAWQIPPSARRAYRWRTT